MSRLIKAFRFEVQQVLTFLNATSCLKDFELKGIFVFHNNLLD